MRICVIGAGAIGGLMAALCAPFEEVALIARGDHLLALQRHGGLRVRDAQGERTVRMDAFNAEHALMHHRQGFDLVILGVKAHGVAEVLALARDLLKPDGRLVPALNGIPWWYFMGTASSAASGHGFIASLDPDGSLADMVPASQIIGCVVHASGQIIEPGILSHTGGRRFILGPIVEGASPDAVSGRVIAQLAKTDMDVVASDSIRHAVWTKLIGNVSFNPVAALTASRIHEICADEGLLDVIRPMMTEAMAVARALGIDIRMTTDERIAIARELGQAKISMHQDFEAQRRPEIDAIVTAVVELADEVNVAVPTIRMVHSLVLAKAERAGLIEKSTKSHERQR